MVKKWMPSSEWLAGFMHTTYENIAKRVGWKTQKVSQVPFDDLPKENKSVMLQLATYILINMEDRINERLDAVERKLTDEIEYQEVPRLIKLVREVFEEN